MNTHLPTPDLQEKNAPTDQFKIKPWHVWFAIGMYASLVSISIFFSILREKFPGAGALETNGAPALITNAEAATSSSSSSTNCVSGSASCTLDNLTVTGSVIFSKDNISTFSFGDNRLLGGLRAQFLFQPRLTELYKAGVMIWPILTDELSNPARFPGGLNVWLGKVTPIPAGIKGNPYGISSSVTTNQAANDGETDGAVAYASNMTTGGGLRMATLASAMTINNVGAHVNGTNITIVKNADGGSQSGYRVHCGTGGSAVAPCSVGFALTGFWKYGAYMNVKNNIAGEGGMQNYLRFQNVGSANVDTGIFFADRKLNKGIDMNSNSIVRASTVGIQKGITINDSATNELYCIRVTNGKLSITPGGCS